jgi:hypothetical protein
MNQDRHGAGLGLDGVHDQAAEHLVERPVANTDLGAPLFIVHAQRALALAHLIP